MGIYTLEEVLKKAKDGKYAVGMFNVLNIETINSIITAAEETNSPVIMSLPEVDWWFVDFDVLINAIVKKAKTSSVPVVLHYDHGQDIEMMRRLLDNGWTSLMIDGSRHSLEENIEITRKVVEMSKGYGASVEGELGCVPGLEGSADIPEEYMKDNYTKVDEAIHFVKSTGVDALAVAIGTVHGEYKSKPNLNFQRLKELSNSLDVPLVLHGASGLSEDDIKTSIKFGISKVNVFTEVVLEPGKVIRERLMKEPSWKASYVDLIPLSIKAMTERIKYFLNLFGSTDKAV